MPPYDPPPLQFKEALHAGCRVGQRLVGLCSHLPEKFRMQFIKARPLDIIIAGILQKLVDVSLVHSIRAWVSSFFMLA